MNSTYLGNRRSIRLKGYDYANGGFFVTICTRGRAHLFGRLEAGTLHRNAAGRTVGKVWTDVPERFPEVDLDEWVIMPNHMHGILAISRHSGTGDAHTLGEVIGAFKSISTCEYIRGVRERGWRPFDRQLWQRDYYERIIRDDVTLNRIRAYIRNNPRR